MLLREFRPGDEPALQAVFHSSIHTIAARDYSPEQIEAWAPAQPDMEAWSERMRELRPFVVEDEGGIVGYADLQTSGYIDHFYVAGDWPRRGVGQLLMERIHARATELEIARLFSDVSRTAQPFFERFGFRILEPRTVVVRGVRLDNARMARDLR